MRTSKSFALATALILLGALSSVSAEATWKAQMSIEDAFGKIPEAKHYSREGFVDNQGKLASTKQETVEKNKANSLNCTSYAGPVLCAMRYGAKDWMKEQHVNRKRESGWIGGNGKVDENLTTRTVIQMAGRDMAKFFELGTEVEVAYSKVIDSSEMKKLVTESKLSANKWYFFSIETTTRPEWLGHVGFLKLSSEGEWTPQHFISEGLKKDGFVQWMKNYKDCVLRLWTLPEPEKKDK